MREYFVSFLLKLRGEKSRSIKITIICCNYSVTINIRYITLTLSLFKCNPHLNKGWKNFGMIKRKIEIFPFLCFSIQASSIKLPLWRITQIRVSLFFFHSTLLDAFTDVPQTCLRSTLFVLKKGVASGVAPFTHKSIIELSLFLSPSFSLPPSCLLCRKKSRSL